MVNTMPISRDRQWTDLQGGPGSKLGGGGLAGQRITLHKNKAWFKTIANDSKRQISLGRSYLG